jgi:hypothetical protein
VIVQETNDFIASMFFKVVRQPESNLDPAGAKQAKTHKARVGIAPSGSWTERGPRDR